MRFQLLGPLEVRIDGRPVPLGTVKQRLLCATLLLDPNEVLHTGHLAEMLWDEPRPASAAANLRTYAHGLRQALRDRSDGASRLHTGTGGYLLEVRPGERDLDEFEEAAQHGRDARARGELRQAEASLAHALTLWRDSPLAGLPLPHTVAVRLTRLHEQRLMVEEEHVQAKLDLGASAELVGRLREHVDDHPLRQRGWGQLMTALYRTGDIAGAVDAYLRARRALADQLGIDPSPWLEALYRDILDHSPDLTGEPQRSPPARIVVRGLPPAVDILVGRQAEMDTVRGWLDESATCPVVALHGPGGAGKSALAVRLAHHLADRYPGGALYVDLQGSDVDLPPLRPIDVLGRFLRALGVPGNAVPGDVGEATVAYRSELTGRGVLVVLDNARDAAQVRSLLPADASCGVMVTSRRMLATLPNGRHLAVGLLSRAEAVELLAGECGTDRVAAEPDAAVRLVDLCGLLPLAIRIVGARLVSRPGWPIARLVERLADPGLRLNELEFDDLSVRPSIALTYAALRDGGPGEQLCARAFRLIGDSRLPAVTTRAVAALLGESPARAETVLERLADERLAEPREPGVYGIHDLVRLYAVERAEDETPGDREAALRRLLEAYVQGARELERMANAGWSPTGASGQDRPAWQEPPQTPAKAVRWLAEEHLNILAAFRQASTASTGTAKLAAELAWGSVASLRRHGYLQEALTLVDGAAATTERLGLTLEHCAALFYRAAFNKGTADPSVVEADLQRCLELLQSLGDRDRIATCLEALGNLRHRMGDVSRALVYHDEALALRRESGRLLMIGATLSNSAQVRLSAGAGEQAFADVEEALRIARDIDAVGLIGAALTMRGQLLCRTDRWSEARECLDEALVATDRSGDLPSRCEALLSRAAAHLRLGRHAAAAHDADEAGSAAVRIGDRYLLAVARQALGRIAGAAGDAGAAAKLDSDARVLFRSLPGYREPQYVEYFGQH
ncbi:DNA-binding SARP family transcriptional activator [Micromonospora sp. M71_S20]|uniref:AfsR/SARP family transcriptional regulator n=1 Tax=Micromonospora sp. M71_S20 TaxID=592872 RepID=UPI000F1293EB|nr:BTAD domain-containing putative transcriptional regulator [Micromonospora sp. M71_S20]RLK24930.1 DNA-binding SARP family transcriptional activator [Micromonospora sp. M71_S20]